MPIKRLNIERTSGRLSITYPWRSKLAFFLVPFCLFWDGMLFLFIYQGAGIMILLHLLAGVGITYYTLCLLLNRTLITVDSRAIRVDHGPVPWIAGNRLIKSAEVDQLFVRQSGQYRTNKRVTLLYQVVARQSVGKDVPLLSGLDDPELAAELERSVEHFLNIEDVPVAEDSHDIALPAPLQRWIDKRMTPAAKRKVEAALDRSAEHGNGDPAHEFAICHARVGQRFSVEGKASELTAARTIEWSDGEEDSARILRVAAVDGTEQWQFYACRILDRWRYFEERPLDAEEREILGFVGSDAAGPFKNGDDRYYSLTPQRGERGGQQVEQWIYTSSGATTRFRALKDAGDRWEAYVQEPFDSGYVEAEA